MSYIDRVNTFERWLETNYLPASSQLLWYKLLMLFNRCGWAEWVTVDNQRLMSLIQISRKETFIELREKLIVAGLIEFQRGTKGKPSRYKLTNFGEKNSFKSEPQTELKSGLKSEPQTELKSGLKSEPQTELKSEPKSGLINRLRLDKDKNIGSIASMNEDTPEVVTSRKKVVSNVPYEKIVEMYNSICISLNPVKQLTEKRKQTIGARYRENNCSLEIFETVFKNAQDSDFLKGGGTKGWKADFDWLLKPTNFVKVIEGKYDNANKKQIETSQKAYNEVDKQDKQQAEFLAKIEERKKRLMLDDDATM